MLSLIKAKDDMNYDVRITIHFNTHRRTENCKPQYYSRISISAQNFWMMNLNIDSDYTFNFSISEEILSARKN